MPQNLDELGESLILWDNLNGEKPSIELRFQPLYDQFGILEKYEVTIPEDIHATLGDLTNQWINFQQTLVDADAMLKKYKVMLKRSVFADYV